MMNINLRPVNNKWLPIFIALLVPCMVFATPTLDLKQAEQLALKNDPVINQLTQQASAFSEEAIAKGQMPDPKLKLAIIGLPVNSFDLNQEAITQLQIGIQQRFPKGNLLQHKQQQSNWQVRVQNAKKQNQVLKILRETRKNYLAVYYRLEAVKIIRESHGIFQQLVKITEAHYASGHRNQQDVVRSQLELSRLDDREINQLEMVAVKRADLSKWIGKSAHQLLPNSLPTLSDLLDQAAIIAKLPDHPWIQSQDALIQSRKTATYIAQDQYKAGWMLDITYGQRFGYNPNGRSRDDLLSVMVNLDLPLFTDNRQDRNLAAKKASVIASQYNRSEQLREMKRKIKRYYAQWNGLSQRSVLFKTKLLPEARQNAQASMNAYQSSVTDFTTLMRAELTQLKARLEALKIHIDLVKTQAELIYFQGEPS